MVEFKRKFKTSEAKQTAVIGGAFALSSLQVSSLNGMTIGITILVCGYIMGRGLFKKMRGEIPAEDGMKTSEFIAGVFSSALIGVFAYLGKISPDLAFICVGSIGGVYALSRGYSKGFLPRPKISGPPQ